VYDAFLAPLESGRYVRGGKSFQIDHCVWIFAGTKHPKTESPRSAKASDFLSRLTIRQPLELAIPVKSQGVARLEKVYLGAALLQSEFSDVTKISQKVLRAFHDVSWDLEFRELQHFVRAFSHIQYSKVSSKNVPEDRLEELLGRNLERWKGTEEGAFVKVIN
jgi:hypothetical protein